MIELPGEKKSRLLEVIREYLTYDQFLDELWRYMSLSELEDLVDHLVRYEIIPYDAVYPDEEDEDDE